MKKAFTLIELIFVLIIIAILAKMALPSLSATRDDAKLSQAVKDVKTALSDIETFYISQGEFSDDSTEMTNVKFSDKNLSDGAFYRVNGKNCIKFTTTDDGNLTIEKEDEESSICKSIQNATNDVLGTHSFSVSGVSYK